MLRKELVRGLVTRFRRHTADDRMDRLRRLMEMGDESAANELRRLEQRRYETPTVLKPLAEKAMKGDIAAWEELAFGPPDEEKDRALEYIQENSSFPYEAINKVFVRWISSEARSSLRLKTKASEGPQGAVVTMVINPFRWMGFGEREFFDWIIRNDDDLSRSTTQRSIYAAIAELFQRGIRVVYAFRFDSSQRSFTVNFRVKNAGSQTEAIEEAWQDIMGRFHSVRVSPGKSLRDVEMTLVRWMGEINPIWSSIRKASSNPSRWRVLNAMVPLVEVEIEPPVPFAY